MDWTLALAIYGAALSSLGALQEVRRRRSRLRVTPGEYETIEHDGTRRQLVLVDVVNRSDHAVRWIGCAIQQHGAGDKWFVWPGPFYSGQLPVVIPPHDSAHVAVVRAPVERQIDFARPIRVNVWSADANVKTRPRIIRRSELPDGRLARALAHRGLRKPTARS